MDEEFWIKEMNQESPYGKSNSCIVEWFLILPIKMSALFQIALKCFIGGSNVLGHVWVLEYRMLFKLEDQKWHEEKKISKHRYNMRKPSEAAVELSDKDRKYIYLRRVEFEEDENM